jgi:hypothetical protein
MGWPWDGLKRRAVNLFRRVNHAVTHSPIGRSIMTSPVGTIIRQTVPYRVYRGIRSAVTPSPRSNNHPRIDVAPRQQHRHVQQAPSQRRVWRRSAPADVYNSSVSTKKAARSKKPASSKPVSPTYHKDLIHPPIYQIPSIDIGNNLGAIGRGFNWWMFGGVNSVIKEANTMLAKHANNPIVSKINFELSKGTAAIQSSPLVKNIASMQDIDPAVTRIAGRVTNAKRTAFYEFPKSKNPFVQLIGLDYHGASFLTRKLNDFFARNEKINNSYPPGSVGEKLSPILKAGNSVDQLPMNLLPFNLLLEPRLTNAQNKQQVKDTAVNTVVEVANPFALLGSLAKKSFSLLPKAATLPLLKLAKLNENPALIGKALDDIGKSITSEIGKINKPLVNFVAESAIKITKPTLGSRNSAIAGHITIPELVTQCVDNLSTFFAQSNYTADTTKWRYISERLSRNILKARINPYEQLAVLKQIRRAFNNSNDIKGIERFIKPELISGRLQHGKLLDIVVGIKRLYPNPSRIPDNITLLLKQLAREEVNLYELTNADQIEMEKHILNFIAQKLHIRQDKIYDISSIQTGEKIEDRMNRIIIEYGKNNIADLNNRKVIESLLKKISKSAAKLVSANGWKLEDRLASGSSLRLDFDKDDISQALLKPIIDDLKLLKKEAGGIRNIYVEDLLPMATRAAKIGHALSDSQWSLSRFIQQHIFENHDDYRFFADAIANTVFKEFQERGIAPNTLNSYALRKSLVEKFNKEVMNTYNKGTTKPDIFRLNRPLPLKLREQKPIKQ